MSALLSYWDHVTDAPDASFHVEARGRKRSGLLTYVPQRPPGDYSRPPMTEHAFCLMLAGRGPGISDLSFGRYEGTIGPGEMLLAPAEEPIHTALTFTSRVLVVIPPQDAVLRAQDALGSRLDIERLSLRLTQDPLTAELLKALHRENAAGAGELFVDYAVGTLVASLARGRGTSGRVALTERFARSAEAGGRKSPIYYDEEVIGLGLQVRDNGLRTFTLDCTVEGRRRHYFIGDRSTWGVHVAHLQAELQRSIRVDGKLATGSALPSSQL